MSEGQYRLFKAIVIVIALVVTAIYFRYGYLSPHYRYDRVDRTNADHDARR